MRDQNSLAAREAPSLLRTTNSKSVHQLGKMTLNQDYERADNHSHVSTTAPIFQYSVPLARLLFTTTVNAKYMEGRNIISKGFTGTFGTSYGSIPTAVHCLYHLLMYHPEYGVPKLWIEVYARYGHRLLTSLPF